MYNAVSYDIETHGTEPGSVVLSIGAVEFDTHTAALGEKFYVSLPVDEQIAIGMVEDAKTIQWWQQPSQAPAIPFLSQNRTTLLGGLYDFGAWLKGRNLEGGFWSRGFFDENLLGALYVAAGLEKPWPYWAASDARTMYRAIDLIKGELTGGYREFEGVKHYALDDAINDALYVSDAFNELI